MLRRLETLVGWLSRAAAAIATLACLICLGLVCYAVAMRYFFTRPQSWADEVAGWLVVATVMLALPEVQRRGEHVGVDSLVEKSSARIKRLVGLVGAASVALVAAILIVEGWAMIEFSRMIGIIANVGNVEIWMVQALVPLGAALLLLVALVQFAVLLAGGEPDAPPRNDLIGRE
jgi:TRAP-type C4-dicarboxylate transport system permease small subunit